MPMEEEDVKTLHTSNSTSKEVQAERGQKIKYQKASHIIELKPKVKGRHRYKKQRQEREKLELC